MLRRFKTFGTTILRFHTLHNMFGSISQVKNIEVVGR